MEASNLERVRAAPPDPWLAPKHQNARAPFSKCRVYPRNDRSFRQCRPRGRTVQTAYPRRGVIRPTSIGLRGPRVARCRMRHARGARTFRCARLLRERIDVGRPKEFIAVAPHVGITQI